MNWKAHVNFEDSIKAGDLLKLIKAEMSANILCLVMEKDDEDKTQVRLPIDYINQCCEKILPKKTVVSGS